MKTILFTAAICMPFFSIAQSEGLRTGTRIGFGAANYESATFSSPPAPKLYAQAGGIMVYGLNSWFGLRADLQVNFSSVEGRGVRPADGILNSDQPYTERYTNLNLGLPMGIRLNLPSEKFRPYVGGGIMIQANLFNLEERQYDNSSANNSHGYEARKMNGAVPLTYFGCFDVGLELATEAGKDFFFEFRMFQALTTLGKSDNKDVSMSGFTFGGGVMF